MGGVAARGSLTRGRTARAPGPTRYTASRNRERSGGNGGEEEVGPEEDERTEEGPEEDGRTEEGGPEEDRRTEEGPEEDRKKAVRKDSARKKASARKGTPRRSSPPRKSGRARKKSAARSRSSHSEPVVTNSITAALARRRQRLLSS